LWVISIVATVSACDQNDVLSGPTQEPAVTAAKPDAPPSKQGDIVRLLRQGIVPPGVIRASVAGRQTESSSAGEGVALGYEETTECEDPFDDCMVVWSDPETNTTTDEIYSGAYMQAYTAANIAHVSIGWVTREGYKWGLKSFPFLRANAGISNAQIGDVWQGTCYKSKYNQVVGVSRGVAEYRVGLAYTFWGPGSQGYNAECNTWAKGTDTNECDDEEEETFVAQGMCDENGNPTGPGGGSVDVRCGTYQYEISYDGGATWSPLGDPFEICEPIYEMFGASNRTTQTAATTAATVAAPPPTDRLNVMIFGTSQLRDAARALVYRDLNSGSGPIIAVDTAGTKPRDLEAALLVTGDLMGMTAPNARATHVRAIVGSFELTDAAKQRATQRSKKYLEDVRSSTPAAIRGVGTGRALSVTLDQPKTTRKERQ
jgi:hypothetical protein